MPTCVLEVRNPLKLRLRIYLLFENIKKMGP